MHERILIVLDPMLPTVDGLEDCRPIRAESTLGVGTTVRFTLPR